MEERKMILQCKHCRNKTAFELKGHCEIAKFLQKEGKTRVGFPKITYMIQAWDFWQCLTCEEPTLIFTKKQITQSGERRVPVTIYGLDKEEQIEELQTKILYPISASVPTPSSDMPHDVAEDYNEARAIFEASPRSSAALLRLAIEKLCKHLGQSGRDINNDIASLVKKGLPKDVQQALDAVRVVGNNAVHPGKINIQDDPNIALALFGLVNYIVDKMITQPRTTSEFYGKLPESIRKAITDRDK